MQSLLPMTCHRCNCRRTLAAAVMRFCCRSPPPQQELLGCLPPSLEPKATDYIPQMISMIQVQGAGAGCCALRVPALLLLRSGALLRTAVGLSLGFAKKPAGPLGRRKQM